MDYYRIILDVVQSGIDVRKRRVELEHALMWKGWSIPEEVYSYLRENSVVEIFDFNYVQVWRSFSFYKYSSHALLDLFVRPFTENFKKEPLNVEYLIQTAAKSLLTGKERFISDITPEHKIKEINSVKRICNYGAVNFACPVYHGTSRVGLLSIIDVRRSFSVC